MSLLEVDEFSYQINRYCPPRFPTSAGIVTDSIMLYRNVKDKYVIREIGTLNKVNPKP
jgi:hypothetical protein